MPDGLLLLLSKLWFLGTLSSKSTGYPTLDLEGREYVLEARQERLLLLDRSSRVLLAVEDGAFFGLVLKEVAHPDVVYLAVGLMDVAD